MICDPRDQRLRDNPLARIDISVESAVALFTFAPFLSSSVIFETFARDRAIPVLEYLGDDLI